MKTIGKILIFLLIVVFVVCALTFGVVYFGMKDYEQPYVDLIETYAEQNKLEPTLVAAIIKTESHFDPEAVSPVGARGLMQIMPDTGKWIADRMGLEYNEDDLFEPELNIAMGTYYFKYLFDRFLSEDRAIMAYNGGLYNVDNWILNETITDDTDTYENIPSGETRDYIRKVKENKEYYDVTWEGLVKNPSNSRIKRSLIFIKLFLVDQNDTLNKGYTAIRDLFN